MNEDKVLYKDWLLNRYEKVIKKFAEEATPAPCLMLHESSTLRSRRQAGPQRGGKIKSVGN